VSELEVDTDALRGLSENLQTLVTYCDALTSGASGVAYMLPNNWQGPAMSAFLGSFEAWATSAATLAVSATALHELAAAALAAYEGAVTYTDGVWTQASTALDQAGV
jgi:uncharacterized protein YukE